MKSSCNTHGCVAAQGRHADFWQVTGDALDYAMATLGISNDPLRERMMTLYMTRAPFPEVAGTLEALKAGQIKTAILSNGTPAMLRTDVEGAGLASLLDEVLSVEEVGVFKPDRRVYQLAVDRLGVPPHAICFQSSNAWDAYAASAFGMRVVWCNRYRQRPEGLPGAPDAEIQTLSSLPSIMGLR